MTTPPQDNQDPPAKPVTAAPGKQWANDTPRNLQQETLPVHSPAGKVVDHDEDLPGDLSPEDRAQAAQALNFLNDVRAASKVSDRLPESIGRYTIERSLGRGGFAEVFLAYDPELDRQVALKMPLFNTASSDEARQRFEREARLAASLGHPQIIPVYEYGTVGPLRFIAFAVCNGSTLSQWSEQQRPIEPRTAAEIIASLADAVQHAHQRGIVHRDLKPGNVLVEEEADGTTPVWQRTRITDFGLARTFDDQTSLLTQDDRIIGTPAYMSPEQASSQSDIGPAADIWALGMMLFEMLTEQLPFRRDDTLATARAITEQPVPRARSIRSDIPVGLDAIADLCLRKSPADRYKSAHELAEDLRRWLNGEPIHARPQSALKKTVMWMRRNPIPAASIATTFAALGIGLSVAMWQRNEAIDNLKVANAQTARADGNLETAQTLIRDIIALEKRMQTQGELTRERSALIRRAAELQVKLVDDESQTSQVRFDTAMSLQELSTLLGQQEQYDAGIENARRVLTLLDGLDNDLPEGVSPSKLYEIRIQQQVKIASMLDVSGRSDESDQVYDAADAEPVPEGVQPLQRATWLSEMRRGRAMKSAMAGDRAASAIQLQTALDYFDKIEPPENKKHRWNYFLCLSRIHTALGMDKMALKDVAIAEQQFNKAASELEQLAGIFPDHPFLADQQMQLAFHRGSLAEQTSDLNAACDYYKASRETALRCFMQNQKFLNHGNFYILASLALSRSHKNNGSENTATEIAAETIQVAADFPKSLQKSKPFQDNIRVLQEQVPNATPE